jgi:hypothetical protein
MSEENTYSFSQLVALFLSEILRSRKTSLKRIAEIASLVVEKMKNQNSETEVLKIITDIQKDFEEVSILKQTLHFGYGKLEAAAFEREIKEYASLVFSYNLAESAEFLQEASKGNANIQELCLKYPKFCSYLVKNSEKGDIIYKLENGTINGLQSV